MIVPLTNEKLTQEFLKKKVEKAYEYAFAQMKKYVQKYIQNSIYDRYQSDWYQRSYEFLYAWNYYIGEADIRNSGLEISIGGFSNTSISVSSDTVSGVFTYDPSAIDTETPYVDDNYPFLYTHGSIYDDGEVAEKLPNYLFNGVHNSLFGTIPARQIGWKISKYISPDRFKKWVMEGLKKQGLTIN